MARFPSGSNRRVGRLLRDFRFHAGGATRIGSRLPIVQAAVEESLREVP